MIENNASTSYTKQFIIAISVASFTLVLNTIGSYLSLSKGIIADGSSISILGQKLKPIEITNFSHNSLNHLRISVPKNTDLKLIATTNPIEILVEKDMFIDKSKKVITINKIAPTSHVRLLIPFTSEENCCQILNAHELELDKVQDQNIEQPLKRALKDSISVSIIYIILFISAHLWTTKSTKHMRSYFNENIKKLEKNLDDSAKEQEKFEERLKESQKKGDKLVLVVRKQNYFLLKRLAEYKKEILFWRNSLKERLLPSMSDEKLEEAFHCISATLGTHSTHCNIDKELKYIDLALDITNSNEETS